ncbi:MAG: hypothetical protein LBD68_09310 [Zoogloeaceae bacterium]|nr:hypothetical protein [Zoogloeaceae bacterium]
MSARNGKFAGLAGAVRERERGAALVIGLVMLILITIVSLSVMQGVREQEAMAGSAGRMAVAFERAEAGLRGAENEFLYEKRSLMGPGECRVNEETSVDAICGSEDRDMTTGSAWVGSRKNVYNVALYGGASPWYKVEQLPNAKSSASLSVNNPNARYDLESFRITALGSDTDDPMTASAVAIVQSVVVRQ